MPKAFFTNDERLRAACSEFWNTYYQSMKDLHLRQGRPLHAPLRERNWGTTDSQHIRAFENFWTRELAAALNIDPAEVGPRRIQFRPHRSKTFDVCWPLAGDPKILISIKSMQNAYRNITNRIEEALGDSALLRLYRVPAVFGFFLFMLDGSVARGLAERGQSASGDARSRSGKGSAAELDLIEEGGDFFTLTHRDDYRKPSALERKPTRKQDVVLLAEHSLLDLLAEAPTKRGGLHYDALAFCPTRIQRRKPDARTAGDWEIRFSEVDERLDSRLFIRRLIQVAEYRGFV